VGELSRQSTPEIAWADTDPTCPTCGAERVRDLVTAWWGGSVAYWRCRACEPDEEGGDDG
jgi:hypothetical protein